MVKKIETVEKSGICPLRSLARWRRVRFFGVAHSRPLLKGLVAAAVYRYWGILGESLHWFAHEIEAGVMLSFTEAAKVPATGRRCVMGEPVLKKGSTDPAVRDLQAALKALGHDPGPIDGVFGTTTEAAVKAFQQAKGLTADGIVGKVTWINIDEGDQSEPVLKLGSTGLPVRRAQKRMSLVGFDVGGVDGRYGTKTEAAVKKLQQQSGISVDGVVGPNTWPIIDALENEGPTG
jgi:murein L,D-transpeptidase YcbB/YkuD